MRREHDGSCKRWTDPTAEKADDTEVNKEAEELELKKKKKKQTTKTYRDGESEIEGDEIGNRSGDGGGEG